jgi:hypothetical protein
LLDPIGSVEFWQVAVLTDGLSDSDHLVVREFMVNMYCPEGCSLEGGRDPIPLQL